MAAKEFILKMRIMIGTTIPVLGGELNKKGFAKQKLKQLYVNLRCIQIKKNMPSVCWLHRGQYSSKEWKESVNKSMTMKRVL
jgi:isochorismate synthase